jgi:UDP-N-acetylmuramoylalanine--D-glutamate ligase
MKSWLIIGAGVSGFGAAQLLRKNGDKVRVSEKSYLPEPKRTAWANLGVECLDGGHDISHLDGISHILLSPGVPSTHFLLEASRQRNLPQISEIDLALEMYNGCIIAVTGTNGKSTTCAMINHLLNKLGHKNALGGNFGDPPSAILARGEIPPYLVLELSSYQLEQSQKVRPEVAIFTSFSFDHIARHGSMAAYLQAKWRIFEQMTSSQKAILTPEILRFGNAEKLKVPATIDLVDQEKIDIFFSSGVGPKETHNRLNGTFAVLAVAHVTGEIQESLIPLLNDFKGLPHRCELVGYIRGKSIINDSKSTNVESTLVALSSQDQPVILLMGGQGKGESYSPVLEKKTMISALVTFGPTGEVIAKELQGQLEIFSFPTLEAATKGISGIINKYNHPILFSPGCASFDEFSNYEHRGEFFRKAMLSLCDSSPYRDQSS